MEIITINSVAFDRAINDSATFKEIINRLIAIENLIRNPIAINEGEESNFENLKFSHEDLSFELNITPRSFHRNLRASKLIDSNIENGKCVYTLSEIEKALDLKILRCSPKIADAFRKKYNLNGYKK